VIDALRLSWGTLTAVPVKPPGAVTPRVGSWAMTFAPLVAGMLAVLAGAFIALLRWTSLPPLLVAALTIGLLALLTRAIHLDGLADTADGLGSGRPAAEALTIMRSSDIGPAGVATLTLVLLAQVAALAQHVGAGRASWTVALALVVSRSILPLICSKAIPAARADGLGQLVAGSVGRLQLLVTAGITVLVLLLLAVAVAPSGESLVGAAGSAVAGLLAGATFCWNCVRRLGGVTGDVMGACVEVSFTAALVVLTLT
jgi:adenosylcobinamide-GDP ribazoletransferase